jgi:hypothetical protein
MKFKNYFLVLVVLLIILYLGGQIKEGTYNKGHVIALLVLLIFCLIGHFILRVPYIPGIAGIVLKLVFVYLPLLTFFILMVLTMTGKFE